MPNGQAHLMVNLAEDEFRTYDPARVGRTNRLSGAVLAGPHGSSTIIDTRAQRWLMAVEFRSGGAAQFFSMSMSEFCDQIVSLEDAWGESGRSLRERLLAAPTPAGNSASLRTCSSITSSRVSIVVSPTPLEHCEAVFRYHL